MIMGRLVVGGWRVAYLASSLKWAYICAHTRSAVNQITEVIANNKEEEHKDKETTDKDNDVD